MEDLYLNSNSESNKFDEEYEFLIPKKINTRFEFFPGIGIIEIIIISVGLLIATIIFLLFGIFTSSMLRIFIFLPGFLIPFGLVYQDPRNNISLLKILKDVKNFNSKPKTYKYIHGKGRSYE